MDQDVERQLAQLRQELQELRQALGVGTAAQAEATIRKLRRQVERNTSDIQALQQKAAP